MNMINKILFDLTAIQPSEEAKFHGGSEYAKCIFHKAVSLGKKFDCIYKPNLYLDPKLKKICKKHNIKLIPIQSEFEVSLIVSEYRYGVFYSAMPYKYWNINIFPCKFIITIHGLRGLEYSNDKTIYKYSKNYTSYLKSFLVVFFQKLMINRTYSVFKSLISKKNTVVITVSEHSKYSLLNFFPFLKSNDVKVLHAPLNLPNVSSENKKHEHIKGEFFLLISANRWVKNNYRAIRALDELFSDGFLDNKKVVVLGVKDAYKLKNVKNIDRFIFLDYLEEGLFTWFIKNAFCFIYPSLNEGYGYPPLNSMSFNVPVLASSFSSIPEVCGDSVLYFNPLSVDEIKNRILQITYNKGLYKRLQLSGRDRVSQLIKRQNDDILELINIVFN